MGQTVFYDASAGYRLLVYVLTNKILTKFLNQFAKLQGKKANLAFVQSTKISMLEIIKSFFTTNFIGVDQAILAKLLKKLRIDNVRKIRTISVLTVIFMPILLILDYSRFKEGKFEENELYTYLFYTHISLVLLLIPTTILFAKREAVKRSTFKFTEHTVVLWIVLIGGILIAMAAMSFLERRSILTYAVYIILINFALI